MTSSPLGDGQALTVSADVPDLHFFSGRGAKDIIPLYRDEAATVPNLHPKLLGLLRERYGKRVSPEDVAAYIYAVAAHPAFTDRFSDELSSKQLRIPVTAERGLFQEAVKIGRHLLFLHTYGERFSGRRKWPKPHIKCTRTISGTSLPEGFGYDEDRKVLVVGDGEVAPVSPGIYHYEVSGLKVVQSWLGNRVRGGKGLKSSPLDDIESPSWTAEYTSELLMLLNLLHETLNIHPSQVELLDNILKHDLIDADNLGPVPYAHRKPPKDNGLQEEGL